LLAHIIRQVMNWGSSFQCSDFTSREGEDTEALGAVHGRLVNNVISTSGKKGGLTSCTVTWQDWFSVSFKLFKIVLTCGCKCFVFYHVNASSLSWVMGAERQAYVEQCVIPSRSTVQAIFSTVGC